MQRWNFGDTLVVRNISRSDGTVGTAIAGITIQDDADVLAVYFPHGSPFKNNWVIPPEKRVELVDKIPPSAQREYQDVVWQNNMVRLFLPQKAYSVWLIFDENGVFSSWYGNLEAPYIRTSIGIDTRDYALDIVADCDGQWQWKDKDEFARRLEVGIDSVEHQERVRTAGLDFIHRLENNLSPFKDGWQDFQPPSDWGIRELPLNWAADMGTHKPISTVVW